MNKTIMQRNKTTVNEFILYGFSDFPKAQLLCFIFFPLIYLMTLIGNLVIVVLVLSNQHLHTPMFLFLSQLATLDILYSTTTVPQMITHLFYERKNISLTSCVAQIFFFVMFADTEIFLLAVMSYDRFIAICKPLHYIHIMSWKVCVLMILAAWALSFTIAFINAIATLRLTFCEQNIIHGLFCDLPLLIQMACNDTFINIIIIFIAALTIGTLSLGLTFIPYVYIFKLIIKLPTMEGKQKAFSTCTSHLTVVCIFYGTFFFTYLRRTPGYHGIEDILISVIYTTITPLINPFIYSLRNKELIKAFRKVLSKEL